MRKQTGFTIVELLIVIVVIAILAAITIVAYNGIQQRARDTQFGSALNSYAKAVNLYYTANNNTLPTSTTACFDGTACWSGTTTAGGQALKTELLKVTSTVPDVPNTNYKALIANGTHGSYTGPYVVYQYPDSGQCMTITGLRLLSRTPESGGLQTCRAALDL
jgi:prepilin-type N-terminal cleavage/methylation domain-containing protein